MQDSYSIMREQLDQLVKTGHFSDRYSVAKTRQDSILERHEINQVFVDEFLGARYLEIGVDQGYTFDRVRAAYKVAVDKTFRFPSGVSQTRLADERVEYFETDSDTFFGSPEAQDKNFDVVFIDGLHTFEQVLRDLINALSLLSRYGVVILDDVIPNSFAASIPDLNTAKRFWLATGSGGQSWMGDVFKVVFFIRYFMPDLSFRTVLGAGSTTIIWRQRRQLSIDVKSAEWVARATFVEVMLNTDAFNISSCESVVKDYKDYRYLRSSGSA